MGALKTYSCANWPSVLLLWCLKRKETSAKSVVCACKTNKFSLEQCFLIQLDERKYTSSASVCSCSQLDGYNYCSSKTFWLIALTACWYYLCRWRRLFFFFFFLGMLWVALVFMVDKVDCYSMIRFPFFFFNTV